MTHAATRNAGASVAASLTERRRHQRMGVMWMATLKAKRDFIDCMVVDISLGGAKLTFVAPPALQLGDAVALELERFGTLRAETMWLRRAFAGIRFLDTPEEIAAIFGALVPS